MADPKQPSDKLADLSSLEDLSLGTAWSKSSTSHDRSDRPRHTGSAPRREGFKGRPQNNRGGHFRKAHTPPDRQTSILPPSIDVNFYPEEKPFKALVSALKASKRTYELFTIARLLTEKPGRVVAVISHRASKGSPSTEPIFQTPIDGAVFLLRNEALAYAAEKSLETYFDIQQVQVDPPKGNFTVVHRCGISGDLIAPPNYHLYNHLLQAHANRLGKPLEQIKAKIESVHDQSLIDQWTQQMKTITRYTLKNTPEGTPATVFDGIEAACAYLVQHHAQELVYGLPQIRIGAKIIQALPEGEVRRSIEAARQLQNRFPLQTANNIRGRLRRLGFTLYKRGDKGVSYLCAVKRKFRTPGQQFTPEIQQIFDFLDKNPMISIEELPKQILGISPPVEKAPVLTTEETSEAVAAPAPTPVALSPEEAEAYKKFKSTLQMLIEEGYISLFGDGKLFASAPRDENTPKSEKDKDEDSETTEDKIEQAQPALETNSEAPQVQSEETHTEAKDPTPESKA